MSVSQDIFRAALLDAAQPVPEGLLDGQGRAAGRRYNVYRNNVAVSLTEALEVGFPVIRKLIGPENFKHVAGQFLRVAPPTSPLMMFYGSEFPAFLRDFEPLQHLGYLSDVARLELALRQSYHAADAEGIAADALAAVPPEALGALRLELAPAVRIVTSDWPIFDIWRFNTSENAPKPRAEAQDVVVLRDGFDPEPHLLPKGGAAFLTAIGKAAPLECAVDAGGDKFDLTPVLGLLLNTNAIAALHPTGPNHRPNHRPSQGT
ncbi:putative DNA-binding domain-containing protein [Shimia biformata]|uniref:HvfC/BufC family peptide modification chaperone n=1 Tax=Shimia biformata TaxID=1294299 RepID=UPI00194FB821|nr:putative DNA-binding domain-containing protein [Shimia biformata]